MEKRPRSSEIARLLLSRIRTFQIRKMWRLLVLIPLASGASACLAAKRVSVEQLEQLLAAAHGKADTKVAQLLAEVELTERLSTATRSHLELDLPGPESRQSLVVL